MSEHTPQQSAEPYIEWVEYTLQAAANALPDRPDGFLWNARRCAEAVSMACLHGRAKTAKPGTDQEVRFHDLISQLELLGYPKDIIRALRRVLLCGNAGIHVQVEGWPAVQKKARECAPMLIETVRWFYGQHLQRSEPLDVQQALSSLEDFHAGRVEAVPSERPPKQNVVDSWAPRAASQPPPPPRWRLAAASGLAGAALAAGIMRTMSPAAPPVDTSTHTVTVVAPVAVVDAAVVAPPPMHATPAVTAPSVTAVTVTAPDVVEAPRDVATTSDVAAVVDAGAPPAAPATNSRLTVLSCPEATLPFQGERITVGQPAPRPLWPVPRGSVRPVDVGTFCLDVQPVRASEYQRCVTAGVCPTPGTRGATGCWAVPAGNVTMTCVTWDEADAYCRWRGQRMPSMVQWEWAGRHVGRRVPTIVGGLYEWVRDPFPAEVLNRGPAAQCGDAPCEHMTRRQPQFDAPITAALYSWNRSRATERRADLGFRCVTD